MSREKGAVQCTVHSVHCLLYFVHLQCMLYTEYCIMYTVHCTLSRGKGAAELMLSPGLAARKFMNLSEKTNNTG